MARLHYIQIFIHYLQILIWNYSLVVARLFNRLRNVPSSKPTNRREITYLIGMAEEDDRRPESSPFAGFTTQVYFHEGPEFVVPTSLIRKCPKLIPDGTRWPPSAIRLDNIASNIAHVIFYYLLTGTYQSLRPKGTSHHEKLGSELRTGVQAYNAARNYELPALQELAKDEIQRLAQELPFPLVLNLLRDLHLDPCERETWLDDYVQSGLKDLFQTPTAFLDLTAPQVEHDVVSFSNIILKCLANLLANDAALVRKDHIATTPTPSPEPAAIETEPVRLDEPVAEEVLDFEVEPVYEVEVPQETVEPAPSEQDKEAYPVAESEPIIEQTTHEYAAEVHAQEPAEEPAYETVDEPPLEAMETVEPGPELEVESPPNAKYSPTEYAFSPAAWDWSRTTNKPKKETHWAEDEPVSSPPDPIDSPIPALAEEFPTYTSRVEIPEPVPVRDLSHVLDLLQPSEPTDDDLLSHEEVKESIEEPLKKSNSKSKMVKKTLSIFKPDKEQTPEPEAPKPQFFTPNPGLQWNVPSSEPEEPKIADESALLSPASSSGVKPEKKKKKKKKSIFRSEDPI
ncbi:hypothetical protein F5Y12DRAFT_749455 [Xylaria sp. FL1777]|nr:hypothetical protein F5Y12DRAFT_749455 [Xylaria sp. FL1777]